MVPKGLEFSKNGKYLYYTARQITSVGQTTYPQSLFCVNLSQGLAGLSVFDFPNFAVPQDFEFGMIERGNGDDV
jgi:hypothetical protein